MNKPKIIAIDFDGTLAENAWPDIGAPIQSVINALKAEQAAGCKTILWTNRCGEELAAAVTWCRLHDIHLDAVNVNLPEMIEFFGGDTRKIFANEYWDDRARLMPEKVCRIRWEDHNPYMDNANDCWEPYCEECDTELPDDCSYCPGCGARVITKAEEDHRERVEEGQ